MSKLAVWIQVIANVGLLTGLILVGFQIMQNGELQRAEHESRVYELQMQFFLAAMGENFADARMKAIENPDDLTTADRAVLESALGFHLASAARNATMEGHGLYAHSRWAQYLGFVVTHISGDPYTRASFDQVYENGVLNEIPFFDVVREELDKEPYQGRPDIREKDGNNEKVVSPTYPGSTLARPIP